MTEIVAPERTKYQKKSRRSYSSSSVTYTVRTLFLNVRMHGTRTLFYCTRTNRAELPRWNTTSCLLRIMAAYREYHCEYRVVSSGAKCLHCWAGDDSTVLPSRGTTRRGNHVCCRNFVRLSACLSVHHTHKVCRNGKHISRQSFPPAYLTASSFSFSRSKHRREILTRSFVLSGSFTFCRRAQKICNFWTNRPVFWKHTR